MSEGRSSDIFQIVEQSEIIVKLLRIREESTDIIALVRFAFDLGNKLPNGSREFKG